METKLSLLLKKLRSGYDDITFKRKLCEIKILYEIQQNIYI